MSLRGKPSKVVRPVLMFTPCYRYHQLVRYCMHFSTHRVEDLSQSFELGL
jgi:hypothetical protein